MHFREEDVMQLLSRLPYLTLAKQHRAKSYVMSLLRDAKELQQVLAQFPAVRYKPLDQHYVLLRCLGSMSEDFISDLCKHYTWRGVVGAAFLVALSPDRRYRQYLADAYDRVPHNQWLVALALAEIDQIEWSADPDFQSELCRLRTLLRDLPTPSGFLRRAFSNEQLKQIEISRTCVKSAYHAGGFNAAREVLRNLTHLYATFEESPCVDSLRTATLQPGFLDSLEFEMTKNQKEPLTHCPVHGDELIEGLVEIAYGTWMQEHADTIVRRANTYPYANPFVKGPCWHQEETHAKVRYCPNCRNAWAESPEMQAAARQHAEQIAQRELELQWAIKIAGRARRRQVAFCGVVGSGIGALAFYFNDSDIVSNVITGGLIGSITGWFLNRLHRSRTSRGSHTY